MNPAMFPENHTWISFARFRVGSKIEIKKTWPVVLRMRPNPETLAQILATRATASDAVDSEVARLTIRAGMVFLQVPQVAFVYANSEECLVLLDEISVSTELLANLYDRFISLFSARLALLFNQDVLVCGALYQLSDADAVRAVFTSSLEWLEQTAPARAATRIAIQLESRKEALDRATLTTIEGQHDLLRRVGINLEELPNWWWRGIGGCRHQDGEIVIYDDLPEGEEFANLVVAAKHQLANLAAQ